MGNKRKKICFICVSGLPIPPVRGGAIETLVYQIAVQNERQKKYQITILTTQDAEADKFGKKFKYTRFVRFRKRVWHSRIVRRTDKVLRMLKKNRGVLLSSEKRAAIEYLKRHAGEYDFFIEENGMEVFMGASACIPWKKRIYHLHGESEFNIRNASRTNFVLSVSRYCAESWMKKTGMQEDKIFVMPNCINVHKFQRKQMGSELDAFRKKHKIDAGSFVLLFAGRLIPEKGVRELIQAVNLLDRPDITLLIAGSQFYSENWHKSPYIRELYALARKSAGPIVFLGYIDNDFLPLVHAAADVSVIPSLWQEPLGLAVLEGEASGNAVIAVRSGGIPEILGAGCGLLVKNNKDIVRNLAEAIDRLYKNREECSLFGTNGKKYAGNYSEQAYYQNFASIMEKINAMDGRKICNEICS